MTEKLAEQGSRPVNTHQEFLTELERSHGLAEQLAAEKPARELAMMLIEVRSRMGMTQREFARVAGVTSGYVSQLESGVANPSLKAISNLLRRVGVAFSFTAVIAATPETERLARAGVSARVETAPGATPHLTEGERYHVEKLAQGLVRASVRSRLDGTLLDRDSVLGEVIVVYDEDDLAHQRRPRSGTQRSSHG